MIRAPPIGTGRKSCAPFKSLARISFARTPSWPTGYRSICAVHLTPWWRRDAGRRYALAMADCMFAVTRRIDPTMAIRMRLPAATLAEAPPRPRRFKLVSFGDMRPGLEPLYLVDELIPIAGLVDVWGKAKCFKSFWTLDLMLHVAMGWEYRDRLVRQGAVVYCAFEGGHGYKKRIEALRRHYAIEEGITVPLYVMAGQANLVREHATLVRDITEQMVGEVPVAVVLDTLNKSIEGSESKYIDMGNYVRAAEAIRDAFKCVVIVVHHCGLDETRPRGHTSLPVRSSNRSTLARTRTARR
jgi:AAA domain